MATFEDVAAFKSLLQRKGLRSAVLRAPYATAALTEITGAGGVLADLTGYETIGKLSAEGISIPRELDIQDQRGLGDNAAPSRRDVMSQTISLNFTGIETRRATLELADMVNLSTVEASATTGEITWDLPEVPELIDWRILALTRDINKSNGLPIYHGLLLTRSNVTQNGDRNLNDEGGMGYPLTAQALMDEEEGTPVRTFIGGPGLAGLVTDMGFTVAG